MSSFPKGSKICDHTMDIQLCAWKTVKHWHLWELWVPRINFRAHYNCTGSETDIQLWVCTKVVCYTNSSMTHSSPLGSSLLDVMKRRWHFGHLCDTLLYQSHNTKFFQSMMNCQDARNPEYMKSWDKSSRANMTSPHLTLARSKKVSSWDRIFSTCSLFPTFRALAGVIVCFSWPAEKAADTFGHFTYWVLVPLRACLFPDSGWLDEGFPSPDLLHVPICWFQCRHRLWISRPRFSFHKKNMVRTAFRIPNIQIFLARAALGDWRV